MFQCIEYINSKKIFSFCRKKFDMQDFKPISMPMASSLSIEKGEHDVDVDVKKYSGMIGSLHYLTSSRHDSMFNVCSSARYQACPKESHLKIVKRILRYWSGPSSFGLWYLKGSACYLVGFSDFDFAGCKSDGKNTSSRCHLLVICLVSWHSKKQHSKNCEKNFKILKWDIKFRFMVYEGKCLSFSRFLRFRFYRLNIG